MGYRLGVDLGTTWTAAGSLDGSEVTALRLGDHGPAMPSVVAFDGEQVLVGEAAAGRLIVDPTSGAREMKRRLGDSTPFVLQGTPYTPEALIGRILGHVVSIAGSTFGEAPEAVILTHPATWGEFKIDLLREVGRVAGLNDVELVAEPSAAAAHYARTGKIADDGLVGVYDFGGGTFDAAVLQGVDGRFEVMGKAEGLDRLGGVDLDQAVIAHVDQSLHGALRELDRESPEVRQALAQLREACVVAKEDLSSSSEVTIPVVAPGLNTEVRLTRAEFESAIRPRLVESLDAFERAAAAAGVEVAALDVVLLVGGSSRIPLVAEMLAARTGRPIALDTDTKAAVSLGAAGWGAGSASAVAGAAVAGAAVADAADESPAPGSEEAHGAETDSRRAATEQGRRGRGAGGDDAPTTAKGRRHAAQVAVGGAAAAAAAIAAGGVAAAASGSGPDASAERDSGGLDTDDRADDADDVSGSDAFGASTLEPREATRPGESSSLDAFDEVGVPPRSTGPAHADAARGALADIATATARQDHERDLEAMAPRRDADHDQRVPTEDGRVEAIRDSLRARLDAWKPPPGADPAEVAALKAELEGRIDRFDPADGVAFEKAAGDLQQALNDSLEDFQQSEHIEHTEEVVIDVVGRQAAERAEEIENKNGFIEYQEALKEFVKDWQPNVPTWVNRIDMETFENKLIASQIGGRPFDPDRPLRGQQLALEEVVRNELRVFEHEQYEKHYREALDDLEDGRQAELNVLNNPAATPDQKANASSNIALINEQREALDVFHREFSGTHSGPDPALDAALHVHLEPLEMSVTDVTAVAVDHGGLFAQAQAAVAGDAGDVVDGIDATAGVSLADAFDDVAFEQAGPTVAAASGESQMTGGGSPLAPGIRTMAAQAPTSPGVTPDPMQDDALGVPVAAAPVAPVAPAMQAGVPEPAQVTADVASAADPLDDLQTPLATASADFADLPVLPDTMMQPEDELPEDDSPNPLDDLDDPLDPM